MPFALRSTGCIFEAKLSKISTRKVHIVSFDVPFPADYGGVIDVFYKVKSLADAGIGVILHAFDYGRGAAPLLEKMCEKVEYYPRKMHSLLFFHKLPFIVVSRKNKQLLHHLSEDEYPVLFEGIHTCGYLAEEALAGKNRVVRSHNVEHNYYHALSEAEQKIFKRSYLRREAVKLAHFESVLRHASHVAAISMHDELYFSGKGYPVSLVSAFHPHQKVNTKTGKGTFALYHGNLGVAENDKAACYLIEKVFSGIDVPLCIAGNSPSKRLKQLAAAHSHVRLEYNVSTEYIHGLITEAQMNILPTFQPTGIKLKLLAALYSGRHCIVNTPMVKDTGLEQFCHVADEPGAMQALVKKWFDVPFGTDAIEFRQGMENGRFSNEHNAEKLMQILFR